ncbi:hypothetical protein BC629DRAFT_1177181 [Irpex lacteus]|nr:hypothetical protein BC629DRAFT_1177181 [Irpex lacteus]
MTSPSSSSRQLESHWHAASTSTIAALLGANPSTYVTRVVGPNGRPRHVRRRVNAEQRPSVVVGASASNVAENLNQTLANVSIASRRSQLRVEDGSITVSDSTVTDQQNHLNNASVGLPATSQRANPTLVPAATPTAVHVTQPATDPIVISSDSDSDSPPPSATSSLASVLQFDRNTIELTDSEEEESDVESWVRTPDGSPPRRSSRRVSAMSSVAVPPVPDDPPPEYSTYLQPSLETFGFHPTVAEFLSRRNLSSSGLVRIDTTLNYHLNDWNVGFRDAGLSESEAQALRTIVINSLPDLTRDALLTAWATGDS